MALDNAYPTAASQLTTMTQWENFFVGMGIGSGVVAGLGGELAPSINSGARTVSLGSGAALLRGFYANNPSTTTLSVPTQDAGNRVDRLVLRLDRTAVTAAGWVAPVIIKGTSGSTTPPAIQNTTNGSWDLPFCRWTTNSNGTLSGLVDERYFRGGGYTEFLSTARPSASPPRLGRERDTGRLLVSDGSTWSAIVNDTGWQSVSGKNGFIAGSFQPRARATNGVGYLKGNLIVPSTLTSGSGGLDIGQIPSSLAPWESHVWLAPIGQSAAGRMRLDTSGLITITAVQFGQLSTNQGVYLDTTWLLG